MPPFLTNIFALSLSLGTATGVFLHDTRLDKMASILALPSIIIQTEAAKLVHIGDFHTHIERGSIARAAHIFHSSTPGLSPRVQEDKKHLLQRNAARGHHPFDNYNLPLV